MKKFIITSTQAKMLKEDLDISVAAKNNSASEYSNALSNPNTISDIQKAKTSSNDVNTIVGGPDSNDSSPVIDVDVQRGQTPQNVFSQNSEIGTAVQNGAKVKVHGDGYPMEGKKFSKKDIEEARLARMRKEGRIMKKSELMESFLSETEDISALIGSKGLFDVLEAYKEFLGDPQELSTEWNMMDAIVKKYNASDPQSQKMFKERLNIQ